jgi:hypothetical protein
VATLEVHHGDLARNGRAPMPSSPLTERRPVVFTAQSKHYFYCRDAVCAFVFARDSVPLNPFRAFEYFLGDRVDRDLVRRANNNLIAVADELWVFGRTIADGVLFEIRYARSLGKPLRFFSIENRAEAIRELKLEELRFEHAVYKSTGRKRDDLLRAIVGDFRGQKELFDV